MNPNCYFNQQTVINLVHCTNDDKMCQCLFKNGNLITKLSVFFDLNFLHDILIYKFLNVFLFVRHKKPKNVNKALNINNS